MLNDGIEILVGGLGENCGEILKDLMAIGGAFLAPLA